MPSNPHERANQYDNPEHQDTIATLKQRLTELRAEFSDTADPLHSL